MYLTDILSILGHYILWHTWHLPITWKKLTWAIRTFNQTVGIEKYALYCGCCVYLGLPGYRAFFWWKPALAASLVQRLTSSFLAAVNQTPRRCKLMVIGGKTREDRSRVSSTSSESLSDGQMTCGCCFHCLSKEERHGIEKKALVLP